MTLKITPGKWMWDSAPIKGDPLNRNRYRVVTRGKTVTQIYHSSDDEFAEADSKLIAEAGTVANECQLMPRELLAQRDELLAAAELALMWMRGEALPKVADVRASLTDAIARVRGGK